MELSTEYKGCNCAGVVGGERQPVPIGMGEGWEAEGAGGWGRRASFAAAPMALNCSSIHGDKLLNCLSSARKPSM